MSAGVHNCSRWLKELSCESSALSQSDWDLVMKIQSMAQKRFNAKTSYVNYGSMSKELSYMVSSLQKLVELQEKYSDSARYFQQYYPQWRPIREENIKILREIADTIQNTKENCEGARIIGSLASLIGGGTSLAAEDEDSFAAKFGRGITLLGTAVAAGSTLAEEFVLHMKIEESKDTVEKDRLYFNRMWSSYVDCSETVTSLDQIFEEIDANRHLWKNVKETIESFVSRIRYNPHGVNLEMSIQKLLNSINIPYKLQREISDVVSVITTIVMIWERHGSLFELVSKGFEIKGQFETITRGLITVLNVWSKFDNSNSTGSWKSGVLAGMMMDVANIVKTCEDSDERSESENIRKIADVLENEASDLRRMYNHFAQYDMPMYALRQ